MASAPRDRVITWSPSVTLVPTHECFNACSYCHFRKPISSGQDDLSGGASSGWLSHDQAQQQLQQRPEAAEVLLLSGEVAPKAFNRRTWFARLMDLSRLALQSGRLPHTNAGPLTRHEMAALARLNPSMGLMLEGLGPAYDRAHHRAPSKSLPVRLSQLEQAGRLGIPFTTGLLLGLGETRQQCIEALELLALLHRQWGHIQEVILQPWHPEGEAAARTSSPLAAAQIGDLLATIAAAREILPAEVHLQLPPNLWPRQHLLAALDAGIDDLGGIDCMDVINPSWPQPAVAELRGQLEAAGWTLQRRTCVHQDWIGWLPRGLQESVQRVLLRLQTSG